MFSSTALFSPRELFERVSPSTSRHLFPEENFQRLLNLCDLFPHLQINQFCFESPLKTRSAWSDVTLCFDLTKLTEGVIKEWFDLDCLPTLLRENFGWKQLSTFVNQGTKEKLFNDPDLPFLWLEFDMGSNQNWPPSPNPFFTIKPRVPCLTIISRLNFGMNDKLRATVHALFKAADTFELRLRHVGWMFGRAIDWIKVIFAIRSPACLESFLRAISYSYSVESLMTSVTALANALKYIAVSIDISENGIGPKIGIECYLNSESLVSLQGFADLELITEEDRDAVYAWEGAKRYTCDSQQHILARCINHLKIVYEPDKPLQIKAYLAGFWAG